MDKLGEDLIKEIVYDYQILTELTQAFPSCERSFHVGYRCRFEPFSENPEGHIIKEEEISATEFDCSKCLEVHIVDVRSLLGFWEVIIV